LKPALVVFHLFMITFYVATGIMLVTTDLFPAIAGETRKIFGFVLIGFAAYRGFYFYNNFIRKK
jgi:hypothetical protein